MLKSNSLKRFSHLQIGLASAFLLILASCSSNNYSDTFDSLLQKIEASENRLEDGEAMYFTETSEFVSCLNVNSSTPSRCENEFQALVGGYLQAADSWDFAVAIAEMQALRLPGSQTEISLVRDAFVDHLTAWNKYSVKRLRALPGSMFDAGAGQQIVNWTEVVFDETAISETFKRVCSGLGNAQPSGSDAFKSRIIDICDD